eukprot:8257136-Ditylum_brightwellii.AAC.1
MEKATEHKVPAATSSILTKDINGKARKENWNYKSVIGMLKFLVNSTHPELAHAVNQCARFCADHRASHEVTAKDIIRYVLARQEKWEISPNIWAKYETRFQKRIRSICGCFICWRVEQ